MVAAPGSKSFGGPETEIGQLLVKHACVTAALASRLTEEADIAPEGIRRSMDAYLKAARRRVDELSDMAPMHAMAALTQLFIFEGMRYRDAEETAVTRQHRAEVEELSAKVAALEGELKEKSAEVQLLREAVLEVQTNANKQVMDARSLQSACEREIARQAAELTKTTKYCDHLKQQLEAVESRNARQYLDNSASSAVGGSAAAALMLRRATQAVPSPEAQLHLVDSRRRAALQDDASEKKESESAMGIHVESTSASPNLAPLEGASPSKRGSTRGSMRNIKVGFSDRSSNSPSSPTFASPASVTYSSKGVPSVPTEAYVETVYLQMGGAKDRSTTVPQSSVLRHLERTYDDLGDPHRFSRLVGKKTHFSFDELGMVLLQVARL